MIKTIELKRGNEKMKFTDQVFIPIVFGGDINTYSVARAFYEAYQVPTLVFGKYKSGPSFHSNITRYTAIEDIDTADRLLEVLHHCSQKYAQHTLIAMGAGDNYVALLSQNLDKLPSNVVSPVPPFSLMDTCQKKSEFYKFCDQHNIPYPLTVVAEPEEDFSLIKEHLRAKNITYPLILKPSDGIQYWLHPFPTQKKAYVIDNESILLQVLQDIKRSGYREKLILQERIPGNDEAMRVLTSYSDRNCRVRAMCLGHVMLEEHTPHGVGNHAVIVTEVGSDLLNPVKDLLNDIKYSGFSNFDIKFDVRDGIYKFLDFNTRQGRSNYYVTHSGINIARLVVEDRVFHHNIPFIAPQEEALWMVVPQKVALRYVLQPENRSKIQELIRNHKNANPLFYSQDTNINHWLRATKNHFRQFKNYATYYDPHK